MALFFGLAQVYSRQLKDLDTSLTNAFTGLIWFYNFIYLFLTLLKVIQFLILNQLALESWF